jgi:hypothetical protein
MINNKKQLFLIVFNLIVGIVFLASSISKFLIIESFEYDIVDLDLINWALAPFLARFIIGLEFFIGIMYFFSLDFFKIRNRLTIITLIIFSLFLIFQIYKGNNGDCGCFGSWISMSAKQALIKNLVLVFFVFISKNYSFWYGLKSRQLNLVLILLFAISFSFPFLNQPIKLNYSEAYLTSSKDFFKLPLDTLYNNFEGRKPIENLDKGKHILAFLSLKCPHCIMAAKKIGIMKRKNPKLPHFLVLNGDESKLKEFKTKTKIQNIDFTFLYGEHFIYLAGVNLPVIYLMNNGIVENVLNYRLLNQNQIERWLYK